MAVTQLVLMHYYSYLYVDFIGEVYIDDVVSWKKIAQVRILGYALTDALPAMPSALCHLVSDYLQPIVAQYEQPCKKRPLSFLDTCDPSYSPTSPSYSDTEPHYSPTPDLEELQYSPTPRAKRSLAF